ncbi:MAG: hypothetical protein E7368_05360 [Clostridiales bacterium]|nr:hypothetical protein [Clostridiales bacterium]
MENGTKRYLETIDWLGKLYDYVNDQLFNGELVRPVITVQTDVKDRAYGWFTLGKVWKENPDDFGEYEINISAQYLHRPVYDTVGTLIHEICHQWAKENNMQDCSRSSTYHNKLFKKIAEEHGLNVVKEDKIGWGRTSLTDDTKELIDVFLQYHPYNVIWRLPPVKGGRVRSSSTRKYMCPCCGMSVRATKSVNIMCADCNEFMHEDF